jgi:hypothetical protein
MQDLILNETLITKDADGRFSLNDLHKSAGGKIKDLPNKFMASKSFVEVVDILNAEKSAFKPMIRKQGRYSGGTWVCKELVYKYAMWVSAEFELKVIRTFDQATSPPSTMVALNELTAKIESDKEVASFCGAELAKYKKVKKENEQNWLDGVLNAQFSLGFEEAG